MAAPKGNTYNKKWPNAEDRKAACERFCEHISGGLSIKSFPEANGATIRYYAEQYPEDFDPEKMEEAFREGLTYWEKLGRNGAEGKVDGFNSAAWIFNMKNRAGWRDRSELDARGVFGGPEDAEKLEKLKPRSPTEIALGVMALLSRETETDDDGS